MTKFPGFLYVYTDQDGKVTYFIASEDMDEAIDSTPDNRVAVYKLEAVKKAVVEKRLV